MSSNPNLVPFWLDPKPVGFPPSNLAMKDPDGLLAVGAALTPEWLLMAYSKGIFPWFNPGEPILWWTPNPRSVLFIERLKIHRSLRKTINKYLKEKHLEVTFDKDFTAVMQACSEVPREGQDGTWISPEMLAAYTALHNIGHAHSVEVWIDNELAGGLYGVAIGKMFYGESMFAKQTDASKIALVALALQLKQWGFSLIDTQVETPHLNSLGAELISRNRFEEHISELTLQTFPPQKWQLNPNWPQWIASHIQNRAP
ncbi:leucyl/phenylalanyl-tRNA--protein transferase [Thiomicrorhabdus immobilis]|uniref:Leucyl/phenylalanyl-tRNA--protein transferase n=1 Tax=Thiomicrorhabdus immobilis TaxID=2791037 RepID=A0ABM7MCZ1_9GAMM|nr:leucyl/phenylalanyl-tRNA--protein transferase [Thiomicrorhabdus immobilis]BCN93273.1 leucyl/phenylalanyl-tRNA--protein transferase [Thiomicrorhabdus immobilis]